jgi:hypothetical protein
LGKTEVIAFGKEGRILPKALSALAPGRIVIDGETAAYYGLVAAEELVSESEAWLKRGPVHVYAGP